MHAMKALAVVSPETNMAGMWCEAVMHNPMKWLSPLSLQKRSGRNEQG
jgi:hypothetical protein